MGELRRRARGTAWCRPGLSNRPLRMLWWVQEVREEQVFDCVLLPVSFRERDTKLKEMIAFLAHLGTNRVVLLHVSAGVVTAATEAKLQELAAKLADAGGPRIDSRARSGSPAFEITTIAGEEAVDFIYIPWKRKSWIQRTLVGSTTRDVIRLSELPVLVSKHTRSGGAGRRFRVLYPTSFSDTDRYVVPYLATRGLAADELILLTVRDRAPDPTADNREHRARVANLERLAHEVQENYKAVTELELIGNPRRDIPRVARRRDVDFLILGKSDRTDALAAMMGSVAEEVANSAPCSVFIVGRPYLPQGGAS